MTLPNTTRIRLEYAVYPCQPLISAACIVQLFTSPEEARAPCEGSEWGFSRAESHNEIPGAGGQATQALDALLAYRTHGSIDQVIHDLHEGWGRTVLHQTSFRDRYETGMEKARALEPALREALVPWLQGGV